MGRLKKRSLDMLLDGILEAENQIADSEAYDTQEYKVYLNDLLKEFLKKDNNLLRKQLLDDFERGAPLTGKNGIRKKLASFDMEFLEEPTSLITLSGSLPTFMKSSTIFGNMAL